MVSTRKEQLLVVSPNAEIRWLAGGLTLVSPTSEATFAIGARELAILDLFARPTTVAAASERGARSDLIEPWLDAGILTAVTPDQFVPPISFMCARILNVTYGQGLSAQLGRPVDGSGSPLPMWSYAAIAQLEQYDLAEKTVFEWGSGASTRYLCSRAKSVTSVEDSREWCDELSAHHLPNLQLLHRDGDDYVSSILGFEDGFDVIVIDGSARLACSELAPSRLKAGGMIILDNAEWHTQAARELRAAGLIQTDYSSFAPTKPYVQTTSLFLHRAFGFRYLASDAPQVPLGGLDL